MNAVEELKELRGQIDIAISHSDPSLMRNMSDSELRRYQHDYKDFDFIIGDFKIKRIRACADFDVFNPKP